MFCQNCGRPLENGAPFCPVCGCPVSYQMGQMPFSNKPPEKKGMSTASLVIGFLGLIAWLLPILGFPLIMTGLSLGLMGMSKGGKKIAIAGIVLCIITLILTIINSALGAYMGAHGLL